MTTSFRLVVPLPAGPHRAQRGRTISEHPTQAAAGVALEKARREYDKRTELAIVDPGGHVTVVTRAGVPTEFTPCPDFELAPFTRYDPRVLSERDDLDAFILALALAYNDMKDAMWLNRQMSKGRPLSESEVSPYFAQLLGMRLSATRSMIAILHEILNAIKEADRAGLLQDGRFTAALEATHPVVQKLWQSLALVARGRATKVPDDGDEVRAFLLKVRNNVASHYNQPKKLLEGYRRHFFTVAKGPTNAHALLSSGPTMLATRFHFADAAAQNAVDVMDPTGELVQGAYKHLDTIGVTIQHIVERFMARQQRALIKGRRKAKRR